jgi:hypothetical protein
MAADLVPIRLSLTAGDRYTLWAPRWRDAGDEWEAFLGKDDDLFGFETAADLVAFVRTDTDNDLVDHPAWKEATQVNAHKLDPAEDKHFDLVAVEELIADKPTEESVDALAGTLAIVSSIGSVCELPAVTRFFNGNPGLGTLAGGIEHFRGKAGLKRWHSIAEIIGRSWDDVLTAIDDIVRTPDVDAEASARAADELAEPLEEEPDVEDDVEDETVTTEEATAEPVGTADDTEAADGADSTKELADDDVVLGREEGNIVIAYDEFLSRKHVTIRKRDSGAELRAEIIDQGSANGTFIRVRRGQRRRLSPGDVLRLGELVLLFERPT